MTMSNNTANEAVQAKPCPNHAAIKAVQVMVRAIRSFANENLWTADWYDFKTEADNVCALVIKNLKGIRTFESFTSAQFFCKWDMAISATRLILRACPENELKLRELLEEAVQLSTADKMEHALINRGAHAGCHFAKAIEADTRASGCADGHVDFVSACHQLADCIHEAHTISASEWCKQVAQSQYDIRAKAGRDQRSADRMNAMRRRGWVDPAQSAFERGCV